MTKRYPLVPKSMSIDNFVKGHVPNTVGRVLLMKQQQQQQGTVGLLGPVPGAFQADAPIWDRRLAGPCVASCGGGCAPAPAPQQHRDTQREGAGTEVETELGSAPPRHLPVFTKKYKYLSAFIGIYRYFAIFIGVYRHLPVFTVTYRYLPVFTNIYNHLPVFDDICRH